MKRFSETVLRQANRKPGYVDAVLKAATRVAPGILELSDQDFQRLRAQYSLGYLGGPGTELKRLLKTIGITATPNCSCNARARVMDGNGCDWCEANVDTIVGWLREEAAKRKLPFVDMAGRLLVRRAISNFKRSARV